MLGSINFKKYMRCKCNTHAWNSQNKSKIRNPRECKQLRTLVWENKNPSYYHLIYKKLHWDWKNSSVVKNTSWLFGGSRPGFSSQHPCYGLITSNTRFRESSITPDLRMYISCLCHIYIPLILRIELKRENY